MKQILIQIANILWTLPDMNRDLVIAIINPLDTETQATKMLEYLQKNKNNEESMRIDNLLKVRRRITEENL